MPKTKMVVIRQLKDAIPVISFVFDYEDITIDREADFDEFALCKCQKHIDDFRSTFIEFKNANFLVQKIEVEPMASRTVYTREVDPRRKI